MDETAIYTKNLQDYNASQYAYFCSMGPKPSPPRFDVPDNVGFFTVKSIFIDATTAVPVQLAKIIRALNKGQYTALLSNLEKIRGNRSMLSIYIFKLIHAVLRTFGSCKFGDAELTLDYYVYRLMEIALMSHDISENLYIVSVHLTELLKNCILVNVDQKIHVKRFIPDNVFAEDATKLKVAFMKLGVPISSVSRKIRFDEAYSVRVSEDSDTYRYATVIMSLLYSMPGTGWAKKYCEVNLKDHALVFNTNIDEPISSLSIRIKGYSGVEKTLLVNRLLKTAYILYILTGKRINTKNLNVVYRGTRDPGKWRIVNMVTPGLISEALGDQDIEPQDAILDLADEVDSLFRLDGILVETRESFRKQHVFRFRLWREFLTKSDTVQALRNVSDEYIDDVSGRINALIAWTANPVH